MEKNKNTEILQAIRHFLESDEEIVYSSPGILSNLVRGFLVLTNKKLSFYYGTNIAIDKKFIATHPHIMNVTLKEGIMYSILIITNAKRESFNISKINKKNAKEFYHILDNIAKNNQKSKSQMFDH